MFTLYKHKQNEAGKLRKVAALFVAAMALLTGSVKAQTPQYIFNNNCTATNSIPLGGGTWSDQRGQWFYAPGDFGSSVPTGKAISKIYLLCGTVNAATTWNDFSISMGQPSITGLTSTWVTGLTKVFTRSAYSTPAVVSGTWVEFALDKPFPYDPSKPLVVETIQLSTTGGKGFLSGGTPINTSYTGNTQAYGASSATTATVRRYSYAMGLDLKSLASNDMSAASVAAPSYFCPGTYDIKVNIENTGTNQVKGVKINWSKDGVLQSPITYSSTLDTFGGSGSRTAVIKLGSYTWGSTTSLKLKVWTSDPNGKTDGLTDNDTLLVDLKPSMSGTYTVGGTSPSYATLPLAIADLIKYGICSPVTLDVRAGTYSGQVAIKSIPGASATNTVTIKGASNTTTTFTYASTSTANMPTIFLDGADYITLKDLAITNTGATYGVALMLSGNADYNVVDGCNITASITSTSSTTSALALTGATTSVTTAGASGNYNIIKNNTITGGYYCVTIMGSGTTSFAMGNQLINNKISNYYYYGTYIYYGGEAKIIGNTINNPRYTSAYGMLFYYQSNFQVQRNNITVPYYGIYCYYANYYLYNAAGTQATIDNNFFNSTSLYGAYIYNPSLLNVHYNTFRGNSTYAVYMYTPSNIDFMGNICWNTSANYAFYANSTSFTTLDYNVYYAPTASTPFYFGSTTYTSLSAWQTAYAQFNVNSYQQDPKLNSSTDLHITKTQIVPYGPNGNYNLDVDGDSRCRFAPTIGADESPLGKNLQPKAGMNGPDTVFVGSATDFLGNQTPGVPHGNRWYVNNVLMKDSLDFNLTLNSTGTYSIKVVAYGCSKTDSFTKNVVVVNPTAAPVPDFIGSANLVKAGDKVAFTELSSGGATNFAWTITPDKALDNMGNPIPRYVYTYGDDSSRTPIIRFDVAGVYKVCLTAVNAKGSNIICKDDYIRVLGTYNLAITPPFVSDSAGWIYDNGGPSGLYSNSVKSSALLAPCASDVYLVVKNFELECGYDYLRIYDGSDNTGKPLHPCISNFGTANGPGLTGLSTNTCTYICRPASTDTFHAASGRMYLEMATDGSGNYAGFEAYYWSKPKKVSPPKADFDMPSTVCVDIPVSFTNKSVGENMTFQWDLDDDFSLFETSSKNAAYAYFAPGKYMITLIAYNCGGVDTIRKEITVITPKAPGVSFTADNLNPTINDIVTFSPDIEECVSDYTWRFKPASGTGTAQFMNGTKATSMNPQVIFTDTGCYSVYLYAKNAGGEDSLELSCFVRVKSAYCMPTVTNNVPDIGISQVTLSTLKQDVLIGNKSTQGIDDYQNFTPYISATMEIGVSYDLKVSRTTNLNEVTRTVWIDYNMDGDFNDAGEKVGEEKRSSAKDFTTRITVPLSAKFGATVMRIAVNQANLTNTPCGPNKYGEFEDYRIYITPDLTRPVITLNGKDTVYVEQGNTYTEAGATAEDNLDGVITTKIKKSNVPTFDNMIPGTYLVKFDVQDKAGNQAETVTRVVIVTPDVTAPLLVLSGTDTTYVAVFDAGFTEPSAMLAEDLVDGDLLSEVLKTGNVDVNKVGTYTLSFSVTDQSGNTTKKTRVIIVQDLTAPVITLVDQDTIYHEVNTPYIDGGITYTDNYCANADMAANVVMTTNMDEAHTGTYAVVYNLTDCNGNKADAKTRVVIVRDTKAPTVALLGDSLILMDVADATHSGMYADPKVTATDNYGTPTLDITGTYYSTFPDGKATVLGDYSIIYTVSDSFGNQTAVTRTIRVLDRVAPVLDLKGAPSVNVCRWSVYKDLGYDLSDNYDKNADVTVTTEGDFIAGGTMQPGVYSFRYKAVDKSGNITYSEWRIVNVREANEGPCLTSIKDGSLDKLVTVFPNPNNGRFTVKIDLNTTEQVSIRVVNSLGQTVSEVAAGNMSSSTVSIDLGNQASGVYMLHISAGTQSIVKRVVIAR